MTLGILHLFSIQMNKIGCFTAVSRSLLNLWSSTNENDANTNIILLVILIVCINAIKNCSVFCKAVEMLEHKTEMNLSFL